jgi:hypothetical protein
MSDRGDEAQATLQEARAVISAAVNLSREVRDQTPVIQNARWAQRILMSITQADAPPIGAIIQAVEALRDGDPEKGRALLEAIDLTPYDGGVGEVERKAEGELT